MEIQHPEAAQGWHARIQQPVCLQVSKGVATTVYVARQEGRKVEYGCGLTERDHDSICEGHCCEDQWEMV